MRRRRIGLVILAAAVVVAGLAATTLLAPSPPSPETQAAVAARLEGVLTILDELDVNLWRDRYPSSCRYISFEDGRRFQDSATCGDASPFDAAAESGWQRIAAALEGAVPGGRVQSVLAVGEEVTVIAVPRALLGQDTLLARWTWRWRDGAPGQPGLPAHWEFYAADQALV